MAQLAVESCKVRSGQVDSDVGPKGDIEVVARGSFHRNSPMFYVCNMSISKRMRCAIYEHVGDSARGQGLPIDNFHHQEGWNVSINDVSVNQDARSTKFGL